eukprot:TRINITY_DN22746_c2_g4_i1.p2 TRINITY_DN22746_c2_g4~~TRINITY_DN22746_c2_g4_i1.p2  ORF type:complete len:299 (+),score=50.14 TRINITY_DN22746_c2_g4_i1:622-1518(+)
MRTLRLLRFLRERASKRPTRVGALHARGLAFGRDRYRILDVEIGPEVLSRVRRRQKRAGDSEPERRLYFVVDVDVEEVEDGGERRGVHCMQGVSRSAAIVIGYLMWKLDRKYQAVFDDVKNVRGIVNPNVGFISQLMLMQKRWKMGVKEGGCRVWRMGPHSPSDPTRIVPRPFVPEKESFSFQSLDSRFVYVFQCERSTYVWKGQTASQEFIEGGLKIAEQLLRYERASDEIVQVEQGTEPRELIETCRDSQNSFDTVGVYTSSQTYDREKELEWFTQFKQIKKEGGREVGGVFSPRF